jgi:hypothetical protein
VGDVGGRGLLGVVADLLAIRGVDHDGRRGVGMRMYAVAQGTCG